MAVRLVRERGFGIAQAAREAGQLSIALAITLQSELGLKQKDVIEEWDRRDVESRARITGAITDGAWVWDWGLVWNHIEGDDSAQADREVERQRGRRA